MSWENNTKDANHKIPRPLPLREGMLMVKGGDVFEAHLLAEDPTVPSLDYLLLDARVVAKYAKATHLPEADGDISNAVFSETNLLAGAFCAAWKHV
jgi:hypothetical protein